jgi:hypothetical protein
LEKLVRRIGCGLAILLLLSSFVPLRDSTATSAPSLIVPYGVVTYLPIIITNSQNSSTSAPFQQLVQVNSANHASYEAANLQNIEFFSSNGTIIPSWLESGANHSSSATTYWLDLVGGVKSASSVTIYMGFASLTTNEFNGVTVGEAPQLSPVYAQYDNGHMVFSFYDNFRGSTLNGSWVTSASYTVNNGLSLQFSTEGYFLTRTAFLVSSAFDAYLSGTIPNVGYFDMAQPNSQGGGDGPGFNGAFIRGACGDIYPDQWNSITEANGCGGASGSLLPNISTASGVFTVYVLSSTSSTQYFGYSTSGTKQPLTTFAPGYPASVGFTGSLDVAMTVQWARVRAAPPGGVMPAVTFGAPITLAPTITSVTCSPAPPTVGLSTTCTASVKGSSPTGVVSFAAAGVGTVAPPSGQCTLTAAACNVAFSQNAAGNLTITVSYRGDAYNLNSSGSVVVAFKQPDYTLYYILGVAIVVAVIAVAAALVLRRSRTKPTRK